MAPLLTFYGDDFTGSSAVMEVLGFAGVPTMLFLHPPSPETLARYPGLRAIGVAGIARSKDPDWMRAELPGMFSALKALGAPLFHYKVCSTFDSAPHIGSIGVACEIGEQVFGPDWIPLVVGAPAIQRFQAFGTLFAGDGSQVVRLDRHPVMARHPVTPMTEADLGRHLAHQTDLPVGVVDLATLKSGQGGLQVQKLMDQGARILAVDVVDDHTLALTGDLIWHNGAGPGFAVGSQGVEYALVAHWQSTGDLPPKSDPPALQPVDQLFAVSGSCAATTAAQITEAEAAGFEILEIDAAQAVSEPTLAAEMARVTGLAVSLLNSGKDVLVVTARGPEDPALARMAQALSSSGARPQDVNARLGQALGQLVAHIRRVTGMTRIVVAGGDTSGHALSALQVEALSALAPLAPGAPLCRVHAPHDAALDGLEVVLKGGQMGQAAFFLQAKGDMSP